MTHCPQRTCIDLHCQKIPTLWFFDTKYQPITNNKNSVMLVDRALPLIEFVSALSVSTSLLVVLTLVLFPEMRSKLFMRIIAFVSFSDALANFPYMLPFRPQHGAWCTIQGLLNVTMYPCSWLWTVILVYLLYYLAANRAFPSPELWRKISIFCWGVPLLITAVSFSCIDYGYQTFSRIPYEVCIFRNNLKAVIFHAIFFYGLLFTSMIAMLIIQFKIQQLESSDKCERNHMYAVAKETMNLYLPWLLICWLPHGIFFFMELVANEAFEGKEALFIATDIFKLLHGFFAAVIFFYKSPEARKLWWKLILAYFPCLSSRARPENDDRISMIDMGYNVSDCSAGDISLRDIH
jgi:hypothetical protein